MNNGTNTETRQRQMVKDSEKLHPWPSQIGLGPDVSAVNIYNAAQQQRPHSAWPPLDLIELARVSKLIALSDGEFEIMLREGLTVMGGRRGDTRVENPRGRAIATLNGTITSILRRLGITASATTDSERRANNKQAATERELRATRVDKKDEVVMGDDRMPDDSLLN